MKVYGLWLKVYDAGSWVGPTQQPHAAR